MSYLIGIVFIAIVAVLPVMVAAKMLKAGNTGFLTCFVAVILSGLATSFSGEFFLNSLLSYLVSLTVTACVFMLVLSAKFMQSVCISILSLIIQTIGFSVLANFSG